jgi:uncharacterized membrane protein (UPF0127 family)
MTKTNKVLIVTAGIILWIFAVWAIYFFLHSLSMQAAENSKISTPTLTLNNKIISLEIADTPALEEHGLSDRLSLPEDHGMLFVFPTPGLYGFWMKDMHFSLDIIYLDNNFRIISIFKNLAPSSYPSVVTPKSPALHVLEVNAGFSDKNNLSEGQVLDIK